MAEMKRITFQLTNELDEAIVSLRKKDEFVRDSYSEIIRRLLEIGMNAVEEEEGESSGKQK